MGVLRIAAAAGAASVRWLSRAPIGCGARLLTWAGVLERWAKPPEREDD